jgi:hypothetical protein
MQAPAAESEHIQAPGAREESEEKPPPSTAEDDDKQPPSTASTEMKSPSLPQPTTSCTIFANEDLPPLTAEEAASIVINENEYKSAPSSLGELPRDPRRLITVRLEEYYTAQNTKREYKLLHENIQYTREYLMLHVPVLFCARVQSGWDAISAFTGSCVAPYQVRSCTIPTTENTTLPVVLDCASLDCRRWWWISSVAGDRVNQHNATQRNQVRTCIDVYDAQETSCVYESARLETSFSNIPRRSLI